MCIDLPMHYKLTCREQLARTLARGRVQLFSAPHPAANRRPGQLVVTSRPITVASAAGALSRGSSVSYVPLSGSEPITMCSDPGALIDSLDAAAAAAAAAAAGAATTVAARFWRMPCLVALQRLGQLGCRRRTLVERRGDLHRPFAPLS